MATQKAIRDYLADLATLGVRPSQYFKLCVARLAVIFFEAITIGLFLPILQFVQARGDQAELVQNAAYWKSVIETLEQLSLPLGLPTLFFITLVFLGARQVSKYAESIIRSRLREELVRNVRSAGFEAFVRAKLDVQRTLTQGEIMNALGQETDRATVSAYEPVTLATSIFMITFYGGALLIAEPILTLWVVGILGLTAFFFRVFFRLAKTSSIEITAANEAASVFLAERLRSMRLIRLTRTESLECKEMDSRNEWRFRVNFGFAKSQGVLSALSEPIAVVACFAVIYLGVNVFGLALEGLAMFVIVLARLTPMFKEVVSLSQTLVAFRTSLHKVASTLRTLLESREPDDGVPAPMMVKEGIAFRSISVTYPGSDQPALKDISTQIAVGTITALVGPSGAGKSTLIDLLPRLRQPSSGKVEIDGQDVALMELSGYRHLIGYVPQHPQLFDTTVAEHIALGVQNPSFQNIQAAALAAGADSFIAQFPKGYQTRLGENGSLISGGQRQRLDLARVLMSGADILIFDEPTSNLDAESEAQFMATIRHLARENRKTIFVVTHRLSSLVHVDNILLMENGRIVMEGTHDDLMSRKGWYRDACGQQGLLRKPGQVTIESNKHHG